MIRKSNIENTGAVFHIVIHALIHPVATRLSWLAVPGLVAVLSLPAVAEMKQNELSTYRHYTGVLPEPQQTYAIYNGQDFRFDAQTVLVVPDEADREGARLLAADLKWLAGLEVTMVNDLAETEGRRHVVITRANAEAIDTQMHRLRDPIGETRAEGYRLVVDGQRIVIEGHDAPGAFYGVQTLRQLLRADQTVPSLAILDWPEMEWRIAYGSFAGRVATTKELIDLYLESAAAAKMNIVIPAYLEAVAYYMEGADGLRRGLNHQAQANLIRAIDRLHSLGIHSHEATQGFRETAKRSWIPAETLLGFEVPNQP